LATASANTGIVVMLFAGNTFSNNGNVSGKPWKKTDFWLAEN
jgi:hypothetical protein